MEGLIRIRMDMNLITRIFVILSVFAISFPGRINTECPATVHPKVKGFGPDCRYRCNCANNEQCDEVTGECPTDCLDGWMGPACQYRNYARMPYDKVHQYYNTSHKSEYAVRAIDGNESTCTKTGSPGQPSQPKQQWWRAEFKIQQYIIGLLIKIPDTQKEKFRGFSIAIGNGTENLDSCYEHGSDTNGEVTMIVNCVKPIVGNILEIKLAHDEPSPLVLCEVEIFGGRLISFHRHTSLQSVLEYEGLWNSSYAVDGRTMAPDENQNVQNSRTCSATVDAQPELRKWWNVQLENVYNIQGISFFGRLTSDKIGQYSSYSVLVADDGTSDKQVDIFKDAKSKSVYDYNPKSANYTMPFPGSVIKVQRSAQILVICEFEAFGECPLGKCGWECNETCMCSSQTTGLHKIEGTCPYGCSGRWSGHHGMCNVECSNMEWGPDCNMTCGHCKTNLACNVSNGTCPESCKPGWMPPFCVDECNDGEFGVDCNSTCGNCKNFSACNKENGVCTNGCQPGYKGSFCDYVCDNGTYGNNCSETCGYCLGSVACDHVTGHCDQVCEAGFIGSICKDVCDNGTYGNNCTETCGYCLESVACNHITGYCDQGCGTGYTGILCKDVCDNGTYGNNCSETCGYCLESVACNHITGYCDQGCGTGYTGILCNDVCDNGTYGNNCSETCGYCLESVACNHITGYCDQGCVTGYTGILCKDVCDNGTYGNNCSETCGYCLESVACNHITGYCDQGCVTGYTGILCKDVCDNGTYGNNCSETCGYCLESVACNHITGYCDQGCVTGYTGILCKDVCDNGTYGNNCSETCGYCLESVACNHITGYCDQGCGTGYTGILCKDVCDNGTYGNNCSETCGYCLESVACNHITGFCDQGCGTGYTGILCKDVCDSGTFGINCSETCGECLEPTTCNHVTGYCVDGCGSGHKGHLCKEVCDAGTYGQDCKHNCGNCMELSDCHRSNGQCLTGCVLGWKGSLCNTLCNNGTYGQGCKLSCGSCAGTEQCNQSTGACPRGCSVGFEGDFCFNKKTMVKRTPIETIVGVTVGVVIAVAFAAAALFIIKRRIQRKPNANNNSEDINNTDNTFLNNLAAYTTDNKKTNTETPDPIYCSRQDSETSIPVSQLRNVCCNAKVDCSVLFAQFESLPYGLKHDASEAQEKGHKSKNRYRDMYPYNKNRVILPEIPDTLYSTYINASYIDGYTTSRKYVAAQGALKTTVDDIWRMLWLEKISVIVMLTKCHELGRLKCFQYWSEEKPYSSGNLCIEVTTIEEYSDFKIRTFNCSKTNSKEQRTVLQFHYTAWPDKDVPDTALSLVQFWRTVRQHDMAKNVPWLIHCSAGVGRTGTFIALDYLYDQGLAEGIVDIREAVNSLRTQRLNMVQTKKQYVYLHAIVAEVAEPIGTVCKTEEFRQGCLELLTNRRAGTEALFDEFKRICQATEEGNKSEEDVVYSNITDKQSADANRSENLNKTRNSDIFPADIHRPRLSMMIEGRNDFINAVLIPTFRQTDRMILTQVPLENTAVDFLRMAWQYDINTVVLLEETITEDGRYWPSPCTTKTIGPFVVELVLEKIDQCYTYRTLRYTLSGRNEQKEVRQFHFTQWPNSSMVPNSTEAVLRLLSEIERVCQNPPHSPMVIQCNDGAKKSGLFCVICSVLERMKLDREVAIAETVMQVRIRRNQVIDNYEQYKFCYNVVRDYLESFDVYANVM